MGIGCPVELLGIETAPFISRRWELVHSQGETKPVDDMRFSMEFTLNKKFQKTDPKVQGSPIRLGSSALWVSRLDNVNYNYCQWYIQSLHNSLPVPCTQLSIQYMKFLDSRSGPSTYRAKTSTRRVGRPYPLYLILPAGQRTLWEEPWHHKRS